MTRPCSVVRRYSGAISKVRTYSAASRTKWAEQSKLTIIHLCGLTTTLSACSTPSSSPRCSGAMAAVPAHAASTCSMTPWRRQIAPIRSSRSNPEAPVVPTVATTRIGVAPAAASPSIAERSPSSRIPPSSPIGIARRLSLPSPAMRAAFSTEEWASTEV